MEQITQGVKTVREIPPLIKPEENRTSFRQLRVAAYCRVSTHKLDQANSLESQQRYFNEYILRNPLWELHEIYIER